MAERKRWSQAPDASNGTETMLFCFAADFGVCSPVVSSVCYPFHFHPAGLMSQLLEDIFSSPGDALLIQWTEVKAEQHLLSHWEIQLRKSSEQTADRVVGADNGNVDQAS